MNKTWNMIVLCLRAQLWTRYKHAGLPGGLTADELLQRAISLSAAITVVSGMILVVTLGNRALPLSLFALPLGPLLLVAQMNARIESRQRQIRLLFPYALDLMSLLLASGAGLPIALSRLANCFENGALGEEFRKTLSELELGLPREQVYRNLANRTNVSEVARFTEALLQADRLGEPPADALARLSETLLSQRYLQAQNEAGRASVLVMLPSSLVLVGSMLLLFGPLLIRLLSGGGLR